MLHWGGVERKEELACIVGGREMALCSQVDALQYPHLTGAIVSHNLKCKWVDVAPCQSHCLVLGHLTAGRQGINTHKATQMSGVECVTLGCYRSVCKWIRSSKFKVSRINIIWDKVEPCLLLHPGVKHQLEEEDLVRLSEII